MSGLWSEELMRQMEIKKKKRKKEKPNLTGPGRSDLTQVAGVR
jgi:hypothetical protein